jgi:hypothetical protein
VSKPHGVRVPPWRAVDRRDVEDMYRWCNKMLGPITQRLPQAHLFIDNQDEPPKGRGRPRTVSSNLEDAVQDVQRIRNLWRRHYGKRNRHPTDGPSAVDIAVRRWRGLVTRSDIERQLRRKRAK